PGVPGGAGRGEWHAPRPVTRRTALVDVGGDSRQGDVRGMEPVTDEAGVLAEPHHSRARRIRLARALQIDGYRRPGHRGRRARELSANRAGRELARVDVHVVGPRIGEELRDERPGYAGAPRRLA